MGTSPPGFPGALEPMLVRAPLEARKPAALLRQRPVAVRVAKRRRSRFWSSGVNLEGYVHKAVVVLFLYGHAPVIGS